MKKLIVTDIFGCTDAVEKMASELNGDIEIVEPYADEKPSFESDSDAYRYFSEQVGFKQYCQRLVDAVEQCNQPVSLLGFSVGAAAVWWLSGQTLVNNVSANYQRRVSFLWQSNSPSQRYCPKFSN